MNKLYHQITDRILADLERGAAPWVQPWSRVPAALPVNAVTGHPYRGCNVVLLWAWAQHRGWQVPHYLTYRQAQAYGGHVRRGEHGCPIYFWRRIEVRDCDTDDVREVPMLRCYTVFHVSQCEGLPAALSAPVPYTPRHADARDATIEAFVRATGADVREGLEEAYYAPAGDYIAMPHFEAFTSANDYYNTLFHELAHWTGHQSRLNRDLRARFQARAAAAEELVAELCSAFLCAEFGLDGDLRHAGYIASWIALLRDDARAFVTAAARAQAAADYLRGLALADDEEDETTLADAA